MANRPDPRITEIVDLLPVDGSSITHANWRAAIIASGKLGNLQLMRAAQQQKRVVMEITDPDDPAGSLSVKRAPAVPNA